MPQIISSRDFNSAQVIEKVLETGQAHYVRGSFDSRYVAVYGTLRLGEGNWSRFLKGKADYVETRKIPGIKWAENTISATYNEGFLEEENCCTLDIFRIKDEGFASTNLEMDGLEGSRHQDPWYMATAIPLMIDGNLEVVKFYDAGRASNGIQDRAISLYGENVVSVIKSRLGNHVEENFEKFETYYQSADAQKDFNLIQSKNLHKKPQF